VEASVFLSILCNLPEASATGNAIGACGVIQISNGSTARGNDAEFHNVRQVQVFFPDTIFTCFSRLLGARLKLPFLVSPTPLKGQKQKQKRILDYYTG
jgi:hypothetical protein